MHTIWITLIIIIAGYFGNGIKHQPVANTKKYSLIEYIETYSDLAIEEMIFSGIPASITMAQSILESGYGNSILALNANNYFGIKCKPEWNGETFYKDKNCYKKYLSVYDSWHDHSLHIKSRSWYANLFNLNQKDYKSWAFGLKKAGYATDPQYAYILIKLIEKYKLYELDEEALCYW